MKLFKKQFNTTLCDFTVVSDGTYIINLSFGKNNLIDFFEKYFKGAEILEGDSLCDQCESEIKEYFACKRKYFTVPTKLYGTEYQQKLWNALQTIPYGRTVSYSGISKFIGQGGPRAAGSALSKNPIAIIYPCHRVIKNDGKLGGFAGGHQIDTIKLKLLETEGIKINP